MRMMILHSGTTLNIWLSCGFLHNLTKLLLSRLNQTICFYYVQPEIT